MHTFGRVIGFGLQIFAFLLIVNDHPNPLQYEPWFGSFFAEKTAGVMVLLIGVITYYVFGGRYTLITKGFSK